MPRIPRARAKSTPRAGVTPCIHKVSREVDQTIAYVLGEPFEVTTHWVPSEGHTRACTADPEAGTEGRCRYCESAQEIRIQAYLPALLVTQGPDGRTLTPVAINIPPDSYKKFPKVRLGHKVRLRREGQQHRVTGQVLESLVLPPGCEKLFDVLDVVDYQLFKHIDPTRREPEVPIATLDQVIRAIGAIERRAAAERGKAREAEARSQADDLTAWSTEDLQLHLANCERMGLAFIASQVREELHRRGAVQAVEPPAEPAIAAPAAEPEPVVEPALPATDPEVEIPEPEPAAEPEPAFAGSTDTPRTFTRKPGFRLSTSGGPRPERRPDIYAAARNRWRKDGAA